MTAPWQEPAPGTAASQVPTQVVIPPRPRSAAEAMAALRVVCYTLGAVAIALAPLLFFFGCLGVMGDPGDGDWDEFVAAKDAAARFAFLALLVSLIIGGLLFYAGATAQRISRSVWQFNPAPGWPPCDVNWAPHSPVVVPPTWPAPPPGWKFWVRRELGAPPGVLTKQSR